MFTLLIVKVSMCLCVEEQFLFPISVSLNTLLFYRVHFSQGVFHSSLFDFNMHVYNMLHLFFPLSIVNGNLFYIEFLNVVKFIQFYIIFACYIWSSLEKWYIMFNFSCFFLSKNVWFNILSGIYFINSCIEYYWIYF